MSGVLFGGLTGRSRVPAGLLPDAPLIVAIHGGSYTSAYFDLPGYSLLDRSAVNGIPAIAPDRPGYVGSPMLPPEETTIAGNACALTEKLGEAWERFGAGTRGIVLIGHSIGGAIAATMASAPGGLPLIGLAISGVCLRTPDAHRPQWEALPDTPTVDLPASMKDQLMFGPPGSFDASMPAASHAANAPAPKGELVDIVSTWAGAARGVLGAISVPVHYRQGEFDHLWIVDQGEVDGFARALTRAPHVDAAMLCGTGHCMDFHRIGAAFHTQQLGFAMQCAAQKG